MENNIRIVEQINKKNEELYGKIAECCGLHSKFCRCAMFREQYSAEKIKNEINISHIGYKINRK